MIPCPEFARRMALSAGCHPDDVDDLWGRHCELVDADPGRGPTEYGGRRWKGLVDDHVKKPRLETVRADDPVMIAARKAEREAKKLEEIEYLKTAIPLQEYIGDLRVKPDFGEELTPLEAHIARFRDPYPGEEPGLYLYAALDGYRGPIAECHIRRRKV